MIPILQKRKLRLRAWSRREPAIVPAASCLPLGADQPGLGRKGPVFQGLPTITWVDKLLATERSPQRPRRQRGPGKLRGLRNAAPLCCILRPWGCMWQHPVPYPESQNWEVAGGSLLQKGPSPVCGQETPSSGSSGNTPTAQPLLQGFLGTPLMPDGETGSKRTTGLPKALD